MTDSYLPSSIADSSSVSGDHVPGELLPCPFCGGSQIEIHPNGRVWMGMKWSEPASVSVRHWCDPVEGQPSRMIERVGRDEPSAIAAWNRRTLTTSIEAAKKDAERYRWLREHAVDAHMWTDESIDAARSK